MTTDFDTRAREIMEQIGIWEIVRGVVMEETLKDQYLIATALRQVEAETIERSRDLLTALQVLLVAIQQSPCEIDDVEIEAACDNARGVIRDFGSKP